MGFIDFLKDTGASIFGGGDEAEDIKKLVEKELKGGISQLDVKFDDGVVTLAGTCDSQATKEKALLIAGNVKGVEKVNADNLQAPPAREETEYYTIVKGDSLSKIAKRYYSDAMKYPVIFEANREVIKDPNLIYPGQRIRIPNRK